MRDSLAYDKDFITGTLNEYIKHKPDKALARGIATVQILDEAGNVIREVQSENIITDDPALKQYAGFCDYALLNKDSINRYKYRPFNGIILTDYAGPESSEDIIRGYPIGYANTYDVLSSDNVCAGNYNKAESSLTFVPTTGVLADDKDQMAKYHWHIVIDFPTHAANGTFQTIYAGPYPCGNAGYPYDSTYYYFYPLRKFSDTLGADISWVTMDSRYHNQWTYNNGYTVLLNKVWHDSEGNKGVGFELYVLNMVNKEYTKYTVDNTWYPSSSLGADIWDVCSGLGSFGTLQYDGIHNILYVAMDSGGGDSSKFSLFRDLIKIDLTAKKVSKFSMNDDLLAFKGKEIYGYINGQFCVKDGYLYVSITKCDKDSSDNYTMINFIMLKYDSNGTLVKSGNYEVSPEDYQVSSLSDHSMVFGPSYIACRAKSKNYEIPVFDYDLNFIGFNPSNYLGLFPDNDSGSGAYIFNDDFKGFMRAWQSFDIGKGELTCYCIRLPRKPTSHNRLPAPVTKTSANTMKLQYDIYFTKYDDLITIPEWDK